MVILFGSTGYVGSMFAEKLDRFGIHWKSIRHVDINLTDPVAIRVAAEKYGATFVINCAGFTGKPNVDACEKQKFECLSGNCLVPAAISQACRELGIPWGHVSSGCIFTGQRAGCKGYTEEDVPNFTFRQNNCSFYSGTKALGEELIADDSRCFIWRIRLPFDHRAGPRNYLQKLMTYERLLQAENSLSHLEEVVIACIECWQQKLPFGTYHLTNPGSVWTTEVVEMIVRSGVCTKEFHFFGSESEFMQMAAKAPRSNCVLDSSKAIASGLSLSPIQECIAGCLSKWTAA